jgi:hypothetical protein
MKISYKEEQKEDKWKNYRHFSFVRGNFFKKKMLSEKKNLQGASELGTSVKKDGSPDNEAVS